MSLTQGLQLPFGIQPVNPVPVDSWSGPYDGVSLQEAIDLANSTIPIEIRFQSMEVRLIVDGIAKKFWYRDGVNNTDLIELLTSSTGGATPSTFQQVLTAGNIAEDTSILSYDNVESPSNVTKIEYDSILINDFVDGDFNVGIVINKYGLQFSKYVDGDGFRGINVSYEELTDNDFKTINFKNESGTIALLSDISSSFYLEGTTDYSYDTTSAIYRTGSLSIGTGTADNSRFVVSSSGGTTSLVVDESGNIYNGDTTSYNTKFGYQAHYNSYQSYELFNSYNTVVGYQAAYKTGLLPQDFVARLNTVVGYQSLYNNIDGEFNVAVGAWSLYKTTTSGNSAIGYRSLYNNTNGQSNTAVGSQTLEDNIGGQNNTVIGYQSLKNNTTGSYNIAIGAGSGLTSIIGSSNINSNNSIFIGYNSKSFNTSSTNEIVIGATAIGNGSNSVTLGNDNITKTILKGNIGIGTASPSTKLHVYGTQSGVFRLEDGTQGNGYILTSDANGVATWTVSIYATDSNVVHTTGNEFISGIKTFENIGVLTNVVIRNYNTNSGSSALSSITANGGIGIKSENTSSGIGIYSNSTSTGLNYVGANNGVTTFSVNKTGAVSIGTGSVTTYGPSSVPVDGRFTVSSSGGTVSLVVDESGNIFSHSINNNTKFGFQALNSATSSLIPFGGQSCVAIGDNALYSCTSGSLNIAIGVSALFNTTIANSNVAIGTSALAQNVTGGQNTAIGSNSLTSNKSSFNVAVGSSALSRNIDGTYNIALGYQSGTIISGTGDINTGTGATNSNNSIFIGYFTSPSEANNTNEIVIGHGATGNGSNSVTLGNNSITRTYLKGSVVIADGTQGVGKILTSDANGVASWTSSLTGLSLLGNSEVISTAVIATASVVVYDYSLSSLWYHATASTNFTANFTNLPTTNNRVLTASIVINQGLNGYIPNIVQIEGVTQSVKWPGGTQSGTSYNLDIVTFNFIRTGNTWTNVIGQVASFT